MGRAALTDMEVGRSIYVVRGKIEHLRRYVTDPLPVLLVSAASSTWSKSVSMRRWLRSATIPIPWPLADGAECNKHMLSGQLTLASRICRLARSFKSRLRTSTLRKRVSLRGGCGVPRMGTPRDSLPRFRIDARCHATTPPYPGSQTELYLPCFERGQLK